MSKKKREVKKKELEVKKLVKGKEVKIDGVVYVPKTELKSQHFKSAKTLKGRNMLLPELTLRVFLQDILIKELVRKQLFLMQEGYGIGMVRHH